MGGHETGNSVYRNRRRRQILLLSAGVPTLGLLLSAGACAHTAGEVAGNPEARAAAREIAEHAVQAGKKAAQAGEAGRAAYNGWRLSQDGRMLVRGGEAADGSVYEADAALKRDAHDSEITMEDIDNVKCVYSITEKTTGAATQLARGTSIMQLYGDGKWYETITINEFKDGLAGSPCEIVEKALPDTE